MIIEEKLKELILSRYNSIREFSIRAEIPNSTLESMFKRGIGNSSLTNVLKLCKALNISADALADGEILPAKKTPPNLKNDWIEAEDVLDHTKNILIHHEGITIDGKRIGVNAIDSIIDSIDIGLELAKKKTKL